MYTKHTLFLYFSDFSIFFFNFYEKKNKATNKNMLNKAKHKTRLTQNKKAKHTCNTCGSINKSPTKLIYSGK